MTDTPVPDVREIAMATLHALSHPHWATRSGAFPCVGDHDGIGCTVADAVLAAVEPVIRQQERELDGAMHSVWLHGKWYWLTSKMTTEQREAAAEAVERYSRILNDEDSDGYTTAADIAWWRPGYRDEDPNAALIAGMVRFGPGVYGPPSSHSTQPGEETK